MEDRAPDAGFSPAMQVLLSKLRHKEVSGKTMAYCPAHNDGTKQDRPSLHVSCVHDEEAEEVGDQKLLLKCFAGCPADEIVQRVGLTLADLYDRNHREKEAEKPKAKTGKVTQTRYEIRDVSGNLAAVHIRKDYEGGGKTFSWPGGTKTSEVPLYGSERIPDARRGSGRIVLVEGEKTVDALRGVNIATVGTATGTSTIPSEEVLEALSGLSVVLWADADEPGERHMRGIADRLVELGVDVRWFQPDFKSLGIAPKKGFDAADHPAIAERDKAGVVALARALAGAPAYGAPEAEVAPREYDPRTDGAASFVVHRSRFEKYVQQRETGETIIGIRTGFKDLDAKMGGLEEQESTVVGAATAVGKSQFTTQVGFFVAEGGKRVMILSTEMAAPVYSRRVAHATSGVPDVRGDAGIPLTRNQLKALREAHDRLEDLPILIDDFGINLDRIRRNIEAHQPDLVIVDHLHRMKGAEGASRYNEVGKISEQLAGLKTEYPTPHYLIAAQFSRAFEARQDKRPMNSDLKDAGAVEQDADWTLLMHRPGFYDEEIDNGVVDIYCGKARHGEKFAFTLHQVHQQAWFTEQPHKVFDPPENVVPIRSIRDEPEVQAEAEQVEDHRAFELW